MPVAIRRGVLVAFAVIIAMVAMALLPMRADATGYTVSFDQTRVQVGDTIRVTPQDMCPSTSDTSQSYVRAYLTDSTNATIGNSSGSTVDVAPYKWASNGTWGPGVFEIPEGAALGAATVTIVCTVNSGTAPDYFTVLQTYDTVAITIVEQTDEIAVDKAHAWGTAHFESVESCPAEGTVEIDIYSRDRYANNAGTYNYTSVSDEVSTDSSGAWEYSVDLYPGNGFWEYEEYIDPMWYEMDPEPFANKIYSLWARCVSTGVNYQYDSFLFEMKKDEYVALGDSFSAGTGTFNYDLEGYGCYRSTDSYAYYLVDELGLGLPNFGACHGAVTHNFFEWSEVAAPPQLWRLSDDTKTVTLTIGGNDIGFSKVIKQCADHLLNQGYACMQNATLTGPLENRLDALEDPNVTAYSPAPDGDPTATYEIHTIKETLEAIVEAAPNAEVYIAGYPYLFGASSSNYAYDGDAPGAHKCVVHDGAIYDLAVSFWDAEWMNDKADELNGIISGAVDELYLDGEKVTYVPPSTFNGHGLCDSGTSYINPIGLSGGAGTPESMHPTVDGYRYGYGAAFEAAMN